MNYRFIRFLQLVLAGLDLITLNLIVLISQLWLSEYIPVAHFVSYARFWLFLNLAWLLVCWVGNAYNEKYINSFELFSRRTTRIYFGWLGIVMLYLYFFQQFQLSRLFISVTLASMGVMLLINRFIYLMIRHYFRHQEYLVRKVVIIGYNDVAKKLVHYLEEEGMNTEIIGFCEEQKNVHELSNYPIVSGIGGAMSISKQYQVNEIYSTIGPEQDADIYELMMQADQECIRFRIIPDLSFFIKRPVYIDYLKDMPVLSMRTEPLNDVSNRIKKRLFDIVVSLLVIVFILSWLVPIMALLIAIESRGPIFFVQERSGKDNQPFRCYKFRSMRVNKDSNTKQATKNDTRLTSIGRFMRRTNIDEFPQFFNVLKGEMSIVGPRPHMLKHTEDYSKVIGQYMIRQFLTPGITGWAQVNGFRGETKTVMQMQQRVEHDIWYMENWSIWLDVRIMFLTVYNTFRGNKNAF
ncbi:MAG TPA: undecaprenyl-phosphate glucose phosphotransferase [Flavitalea sp.]|nr:undecaprenyl-phosphate glucose phosphotransferase [Flavitalea sp.]